MLFGVAQALIVSLGDLYLLKIQCLEPAKFVLAAVLASVVFVNIIYTLTISFGDVGKALAVVLLVIQVAGAGGNLPDRGDAAFLPYGQSDAAVYTRH